MNSLSVELGGQRLPPPLVIAVIDIHIDSSLAVAIAVNGVDVAVGEGESERCDRVGREGRGRDILCTTVLVVGGLKIDSMSLLTGKIMCKFASKRWGGALLVCSIREATRKIGGWISCLLMQVAKCR